MGDMSFSGGFETMEAGKDKEGWIQVVGPSELRYWLFIYFLSQLSIGVLFVGSRIRKNVFLPVLH